MLKLKSILSELPEFDTFRESLFSNKSVHIKGLAGSLMGYVLEYTVDIFENNMLAIVPDTEQAEKLTDDLQNILPDHRAVYFPQAEVVPFDKGSFAPALHSSRLNALVSLLESPASIIVTTPVALLQKIQNPANVKKQISQVKVGDKLDRDFLIEWLVEFGFERVYAIEEIGQFSARGGIVDVFSFESDAPYRIEFFDDEIESIREFDILRQTSVRQVKQTRIVGKGAKSDVVASLFDYLKPGALIFWDDYKRCQNLIGEWEEHAQQLLDEESERVENAADMYIKFDEITKKVNSFRQIFHERMVGAKQLHVDFKSEPSPAFQGNIKLFAKHLQARLGRGGSLHRPVYLVYDKPSRKDNLEEMLIAEMGYVPPLKFIQGDIHAGFVLPHKPMEILTEHEIFHRIKMRRNRRRLKMAGSLIRQLNSLKYGDYVVHVDYGIGKYLGTERISIAGVQKDCVKLEYSENDLLYVNLDKLNHVQKYVSEEGFSPALTRLGSTEWERTKEKTKKAVEIIAKDLVQLYANRIKTPGHAYAEDTVWQRELESSFMYSDTPDQARTTEEVKRDMEQAKAMDRLVCGDVGFGKTEIAVRAAFKTVMEGKQVAILVPTTILAQQHYQTFRNRLQNFPVNVEVVSRFRTRAEQNKVLEHLRAGDVDILVGTHRLLSQDVIFKDLGLLVVDEEQQFGVKHKEKLRQLKINVDTLTLTATPIPRTLQMALMGARDLSTIDTPPRNRLPIITEITTWNKTLIYKAVMSEIDRGGQVFFCAQPCANH